MIRIFGALVVIVGCGGFGISLTAAVRKECRMLRSLMRAIQQMQWELKYRMTELPELCCLAGETAGGMIRDIFLEMGGKLTRREVTDICAAFLSEMNRYSLPRYVRRNLKQLAQSLGRYDLEGQIQGLEAVRRQCREDLMLLESERATHIRNYQTLALCAGAALAILLF